MLLNLGPLKMFKSRNSTREFDMLHVNLSVGCALLSLSRKLSNSSLVPRCRGCHLCSVSKAEAGSVQC